MEPERLNNFLSDKYIVLYRYKYDKSIKPFEIITKEYIFDKSSRILKRKPYWRHYRYYKTFLDAENAIKDIRNSFYDKWMKDNMEENIFLFRYAIRQRSKI
jgi:hypothetical protein